MIWWAAPRGSAGGWCVWLEAEAELAALRAGRDWRAVAQVPPRVRAGAARALLGPEASPRGVHQAQSSGRTGAPGFAWSPTPRALALLDAHGLRRPPAPGWEILGQANARETFADLDRLPGGATCCSVADVLSAVDSPAPQRWAGKAPAWILRASLCAAGQDRLVVEGPSDRAASFARSRLQSGPIEIAPMLDIVEEFAIHGHVASDGAVRSGRAVRYTESARPGSAPPGIAPAPPDVAAALQRALARVSEELVGMGYFGPLGIDAFTWRDAAGTIRLRAVSEVNARYTLYFSTCAPELVGLDHAD